MLLNILKMAFRNMLRHRRATAINVAGLALGFATCLVIMQYIRFEWSYDRFYAEPDAVYRLNTLYKEGAKENRFATTPPPLAEAVKNEAPGVAAICRVFHWSDFTMRPDDDFDNVYRETNVYAADASFFQVLDYGLLDGDPATALAEPASVVLPRRAAIRYFGHEAVAAGKVVGRRLRGGKDAGTPWTVTGLMADQPPNAHFQFDFLISASTYPDDLVRSQSWDWNIMHTYLRLEPAVAADPQRVAAVQEQLNRLAEKYVLPYQEIDPQAFAASGNQIAFPLQPLTSIHLTSDYQREMRPNGNLLYVRVFGMVALLVLLIAGVNYVNLYTAQAFRRAKEVGVKKVMGVRRHQLVAQFMTESALAAGLAVILALVMVEGLRYGLRFWFGAVPFTEAFDWDYLLWSALVLWAGVSLLAGSYPAFFLSYFRPADVLKGKLRSGLNDRQLRNGLVVFQFVLSIGLIVGAFVVQQQLAFFQDKKLGFNRENVLVIQNDREIDEQMEPFKAELRRHPDILAASFSNGLPGLSSYAMRDFRAPGDDLSFGISWYQVDSDHLETMGTEVRAGRGFDHTMAADSSGLLLNEAAVRLLGLEQPVGARLIKNEGMPDQEELQVLGVIEDFHFESLHQCAASGKTAASP